MRPHSPRREIILACSGGQGLVLSALLLAEAALLEGKNAVQTQSYGIASRGGLSLAEVIIDEAEIIFQQVRRPDCVLALTEEAAKKFESWAAEGVPIFYDSTLARERSGPHFHGLPFTRIASDLGNVGSVNILALGTIAAHTGVVQRASLEHVVRHRFGGKSAQLNLQILLAGSELGAAQGAHA
jgi:2-oxoglutarate ferredoxin oxidoreductase subunit gamma